jgi:hypothetical protein
MNTWPTPTGTALPEALARCAGAVDSGAAAATLEHWVASAAVG